MVEIQVINQHYLKNIKENKENLVLNSPKMETPLSDTEKNINKYNENKIIFLQTALGSLYQSIALMTNEMPHAILKNSKNSSLIKQFENIAKKINDAEPGLCFSPREFTNKHKRRKASFIEPTTGSEGISISPISLTW